MSADVFFKRDIANHLLAAYNGKVQTLAMFGDDPRGAAYLAGIRDVVASLALSFGISPALVIPDGANMTQLDG